MTDQKIGLPPGADKLPNQKHQPGGVSSSEGEIYEIKVKGHLDLDWSEWLGDLAMTYDNEGNTLLTGVVSDQAALYGVLVRIRDLGLPLISMTQVENNKEN
jgi:hypothetical protein